MKRFISLLILMAVSFSFGFAQDFPEVKYESLDDKLPQDPKVTTGTLDNGVKYYIRENSKPEDRAELRMVVKAGSVLETDEQAGLAHFIEHMCFNGTKNFPKQELVSFLESTGMRFGADVNANTGFDRTYYLLTIPLDSAGLLDKGLQVLEDWMHNVSFDKEEIDKERKVILEEWRVYRGAQMRIMREQLPVILKGSKYAERLPIGDTSVIKHAPREEFLAFYNDWYRPDLMAVMAVGDFDKDEIEKKIKEQFSRIEPVKNPKERKDYEVPSQGKPLVSVATDKEMPQSTVILYFKNKRPELGTYRSYRTNIKKQLFSQMLTQRLQELTREAEPPFMYGAGGISNFLADLEAFNMIAVTQSDGIMKGSEALMKETFRALQHGFIESELERAKKQYLRRIENYYNERDKTESMDYTEEYFRNFMFGEGFPGIAYEFAMTKKFLPEIKVDEINEISKKYIDEKDLVITVSAPEKEDVEVPNEDQLLAKYREVKDMDIEPYEDKVSDVPLFSKDVEPAEIVSEKEIKDVGVTEIKLSNGATVLLKPTDFKNDEILFRAFSPGGHSLASDDTYLSAEYSADIVEEAGLSKFTKTELEKMLAGKVLSISPYMGEKTEGLSGNTTPEDLETFLQLLNLSFTDPRLDYKAFDSYYSKLKEQIKHRSATPSSAFRDTIQVTMAQHHKRERPLTMDLIENIDPDDAYDFYRERFIDASDFTFIFVGTFKADEIKPMIQKYIGSIPDIDRQEKWKDIGIRPPKGKLEKKVYKGIEPKSQVRLSMTGDFEFTPKNRLALKSVIEVLRIKLRESIREEKGGVYGIGIWERTTKYPYEGYQINIQFSTDPERVDELITEIKSILKKQKNELTEESYVQKAKEIMTREYEKNIKQNQFWLSNIYSKLYHNEDLSGILHYDKKIEKITAKSIKKAAQNYINFDNWARIVLYPEDQGKS